MDSEANAAGNDRLPVLEGIGESAEAPGHPDAVAEEVSLGTATDLPPAAVRPIGRLEALSASWSPIPSEGRTR